jgi:hypothetical protein
MRWLVILVVLVTLAPVAEAKKLSVWAGEWEYRFDDRTIPKPELERLLTLAEHGQIVAEALVGDAVSDLWLHRKDKKFADWATWGPAWVDEARKSLATRRKRLAELEAMTVPAQLEPVKTYFIGELRFYFAREAAAIEYLAKPDLAVLRQPVASVDPVKACASQIDAVGRARDVEARLDALEYGLGNCLNGAHAATYPHTAWKSFLAAKKIREKQHTELNGP